MNKNSYTFAPRKTHSALLYLRHSFELTIIYLPGLYLYGTLGRFFLFNNSNYGI